MYVWMDQINSFNNLIPWSVIKVSGYFQIISLNSNLHLKTIDLKELINVLVYIDSINRLYVLYGPWIID